MSSTTQSQPPSGPRVPPPLDVRGNNAAIFGYAGFIMVIVASILSPISFLGLPALILIPMGMFGLLFCIISLCFRVRWPGVTGTVIGLLTIAFWTTITIVPAKRISNKAATYGLDTGGYTMMLMSAMSLASEGESQRLSSGKPATVFSMTPVPPEYQVDPWGRTFRYVLVPTPRGYTFMSNGRDGLEGTSDDIDLFTIQDGLTFELPPIRGTATPGGP